MDIVKAFNTNSLHTEIVIKGTHEEPLFRASDIGLILDIKQIRTSIKDFTIHEKVAHTMDTLGGPQEVSFLTEKGLYKILFRSRKPIAETFQNWVCDVIKEIRLTGKYELEKQLLEKDKLIENNIVNHKIELKINRHKILIEKCKNKKCVYIAEIEENKFIKIGSSKEVEERNKGLGRTFGNCIFLEVFECDNFREAEEKILSDPIIKKNLYNEKINDHQSQEVVKLSSTFNYNQLINIVYKYINDNVYLTPVQLLEKQKLNLEEQKLNLEKQKLEFDLLSKLLNNEMYFDTVKDIFKNNLYITINNTHCQKNLDETIIRPEEEKVLKSNETQIPNYTLELHTKIKGRQPKGRKIQKIDPNNLQNIIKIYDSMVYALRCPDNKGFQKSGIQTAIKKNNIYKNYRWNFVEPDEDPTISKAQPTVELKNKPPIIDTILELNSHKTEIIDSYYTKDYIATKLKIGKLRIRKLIENGEMYNNHYYIEYNKCPQILLNNYKKPINRIIPSHSKLIKQIHPITKDTIIFNSLTEINIKFGICSKTILNAIDNKLVCSGYIWQYA